MLYVLVFSIMNNLFLQKLVI